MKQHRSPCETIRTYCLYCTVGQPSEVISCDADGKDPAFEACPFHPFRLGKGRPSVKLIRKFCLQCMGGSLVMVRECETRDCLIHPFRLGRNPACVGRGQSTDRMALVRSKKCPVSLKKSVQIERSAIG